MTLYPQFAKKAQVQLDSILSGERLPMFEDKGKIPYIDCILNECLR